MSSLLLLELQILKYCIQHYTNNNTTYVLSYLCIKCAAEVILEHFITSLVMKVFFGTPCDICH